MFCFGGSLGSGGEGLGAPSPWVGSLVYSSWGSQLGFQREDPMLASPFLPSLGGEVGRGEVWTVTLASGLQGGVGVWQC